MTVFVATANSSKLVVGPIIYPSALPDPDLNPNAEALNSRPCLCHDRVRHVLQWDESGKAHVSGERHPQSLEGVRPGRMLRPTM